MRRWLSTAYRNVGEPMEKDVAPRHLIAMLSLVMFLTSLYLVPNLVFAVSYLAISWPREWAGPDGRLAILSTVANLAFLVAFTRSIRRQSRGLAGAAALIAVIAGLAAVFPDYKNFGFGYWLWIASFATLLCAATLPVGPQSSAGPPTDLADGKSRFPTDP
ncbi:MAG TPA: hypothetical protein VK797_31150 [Tepidisphaeraceae bacterium]|jgi:hypothetical protein|nr:hypothetical protein [Tepidisphaeraceae bacterium]